MGVVVDFETVRSSRIIRRALLQVREALCANLPPRYRPDTETIDRVCRIVLSHDVQRALRCTDEPVCVAYLDTIRAIVFRPARPRTLIEALWCVLEQPLLNKVLGRRISYDS